MKKAILKRIKEKIELNEIDYSDAYIALKANSVLTDNEAKKRIESAKHKMSTAESNIVFLKALLKEESK